MKKFNVILPCGGSGIRCGLGFNKLFIDISGTPLIVKTANIFSREEISRIIIVYNKNDKERMHSVFNNSVLPLNFVEGGDSRTQSVAKGLSQVEKDCDYVIIHDGARPFLSRSTLEEGITTAMSYGNAVACTKLVESVRELNADESVARDRNNYVSVQTPQIFKADEIVKAYKLCHQSEEIFTDDASVYEKYIGKVHLFKGDYSNIKITSQSDLASFQPTDFMVGCGWDTHAFGEKRSLILGGVTVPCDKGLIAHSDGDVLVHSVMDALLSAVNERDIGNLFPDTDMKYKNISSMKLLDEVVNLIHSKGYIINNVSAEIMAQKPKLKDFIPLMQSNLARAMRISDSRVSVSATTTERLGFVGREEGISVVSYVSIKQI